MSNSTDISEFMAPGSVAPASLATGISIEKAKGVAEMQTAMLMARQFPRDMHRSMIRVTEAFSRPILAQTGLYSFPKGGQRVTGLSIRAAEALSCAYGNIDYGVREIAREEDRSVCISHAIDLESNTRSWKEFIVPHRRDLQNGGFQTLTGSRDIYELIANMGARRVRADLLAVIPGDVQDLAEQVIQRTLTNQNTVPLQDRVIKMLDLFKREYGVTQAMIEHRFGHTLDAMSETEMVDMTGIYRSLKDGMAGREQFFKLQPVDAPSHRGGLSAALDKEAAA